MELHVASPDQEKLLVDTKDSLDCACDSTNLRVVRRYLHERFPDRALREFHAHSTAVVDHSFPARCTSYHVVSINDERPYYIVLTRRFLKQPVSKLREHRLRWDLASALHVDRVVILDVDGLSQL